MSECVFWHFWINQWEPSMGGHWPIRGLDSGTSSCPEMWCVWFSIRRDVSDVGKQSVSELSCMDTWKILMKICQHCQRLPMFRIISDYFWGSHSNCKDILNKMKACSLLKMVNYYFQWDNRQLTYFEWNNTKKWGSKHCTMPNFSKGLPSYIKYL